MLFGLRDRRNGSFSPLLTFVRIMYLFLTYLFFLCFFLHLLSVGCFLRGFVSTAFSSFRLLSVISRCVNAREQRSSGKVASKSSSAWHGTFRVSSMPGKTTICSPIGNATPFSSRSALAASRAYFANNRSW